MIDLYYRTTWLATSAYLAGDYSIADMACYPFIASWERQGQDIAESPYLALWFEATKSRPALVKAYRWIEKITAEVERIGSAKRPSASFTRTEVAMAGNASTSEDRP